MSNANPSNPLRGLLDLLDHLETNGVDYELRHVRDSVLVMVDIPGERWEVEFFPDDHVEVERFVSNGEIGGRELLRELWERVPYGGAEEGPPERS